MPLLSIQCIQGHLLLNAFPEGVYDSMIGGIDGYVVSIFVTFRQDPASRGCLAYNGDLIWISDMGTQLPL